MAGKLIGKEAGKLAGKTAGNIVSLLYSTGLLPVNLSVQKPDEKLRLRVFSLC